MTSPIPTDLVERVAAAMGDIMPTNLGRMTPWDKRPFEEKDLYRDLARAAIAATGVEHLQSQLASMREALTKCRELFSEIRMDWSDPRAECREGWSVIDAALKTMEQ